MTATPVELAQIIARRLGLTGALGTVAETENGVYTGRLVGELLHGPAKAAAVRALAAREGLDLRRCTAYSDSVNDVPMLSVVGTAVAVNPDGALRDIARERGLADLDFRTGRKAAKIGVPAALGVLLAGIAAVIWRVGRGAGPARRGAWRPDGRGPAHEPRQRGRSAQERVPAAQQQPVEGLLDRLAHPVGEVEHDHRVVGRLSPRVRSVGIGSPNSMIHLLGSGIAPSGPARGRSA